MTFMAPLTSVFQLNFDTFLKKNTNKLTPPPSKNGHSYPGNNICYSSHDMNWFL